MTYDITYHDLWCHRYARMAYDIIGHGMWCHIWRKNTYDIIGRSYDVISPGIWHWCTNLWCHRQPMTSHWSTYQMKDCPRWIQRMEVDKLAMTKISFEDQLHCKYLIVRRQWYYHTCWSVHCQKCPIYLMARIQEWRNRRYVMWHDSIISLWYTKIFI